MVSGLSWLRRSSCARYSWARSSSTCCAPWGCTWSSSPPPSADPDAPAPAETAAAISGASATIYVHILGLVARPGLYELLSDPTETTNVADAHPEEFELLDRSLSDPRPNLDDAQARAVDEALAPVLARVRTELDRAVEEVVWRAHVSRRREEEEDNSAQV